MQGVGFRPCIYRLATEMGLHGYVENSNDGVLIVLQATDEEKEHFVQALPLVAPDVATIERIDVEECPATRTYDRFEIAASRSEGDEITRVSPDIAICPECLQDRRRQPHRARVFLRSQR